MCVPLGCELHTMRGCEQRIWKRIPNKAMYEPDRDDLYIHAFQFRISSKADRYCIRLWHYLHPSSLEVKVHYYDVHSRFLSTVGAIAVSHR